MAAEHYYIHGYLEGRPPVKPTIDEEYYLTAYPDTARAVKAGEFKALMITLLL